MRKLSFILLFSAICFSCGNNNKSPKTNEESVLNSTQKTTQVEESKNSDEPKLIKAGDELTLHNYQKEGMLFLFKEINIIKLSDNIYNLVLKVQFKNNMSYKFDIMEAGWKLTDTDMIEIKDSGVYDFSFNAFVPSSFTFLTVDPGFGKIEEVGYQVNKGTYYLHIGGMNIGKIIVQE